MPEYPVLGEIRHSGEIFAPGIPERDRISLPEGEALPLIRVGALGQATGTTDDALESQPEEPGSLVDPTPGPVTSPELNINSATRAELEALDVIGPATAKKLIAGRPYASLEAARTASGMPAEQWESIAPKLTVGS